MGNEQDKQWTVLSREFSEAQAELTRCFDSLFSEETAPPPGLASDAPRRSLGPRPAPRAATHTIDAYFDAWERLQALQDRIRFFYFGDDGINNSLP